MTETSALWSCPRCRRRVPRRIDVCRCGEARPAAAPHQGRENVALRLYRNWFVRGGILLLLAYFSYLKVLRIMTP